MGGLKEGKRPKRNLGNARRNAIYLALLRCRLKAGNERHCWDSNTVEGKAWKAVETVLSALTTENVNDFARGKTVTLAKAR